MMTLSRLATACAAALMTSCLAGQLPVAPQPCTPLTGLVTDSTGAAIAHAAVTVDSAPPTAADGAGHFRIACVAAGDHTVSATAKGFGTSAMGLTLPHTSPVLLQLSPATEVSVTVNAGDAAEVPAPGGANGLTLAGKQLDALADDPDDLLRELQQLGAMSGGSPSQTVISVDGFQDSSQLPPKSSIAYIEVAPDLFSSEYREPPFGGGGRVEVFTKPGQQSYHGALYTTQGPSFLNAKDPFSTTNASLSKQRYGFDLSGPLAGAHRTFTLSLEHRAINNVAVVNAIVPGAGGAATPFLQTVPTPQRLWEGSARADFQLNPNDIFNITYQANVNDQRNLGVGGSTLLEGGYEDGSEDHTVRMSNFVTLSPKLVNETRFSVEHATDTFVPTSNAPSINVSGYFTGGGASIGNQRFRALRFELDDDVILTTKRHMIKAGEQTLFFRREDTLSQSFNGSYIFSGVAGTNGSYVTPLAQYETASSTGGTATEYNNVAGTPYVPLSMARVAFFFEDQVKLGPKWTASYGVRYAFQTLPATFNGFVPRGGLTYTPGPKSTWVFSGHFGLFSGQYSTQDAREVLREDGVHRITSLIYNPVYGAPFTNAVPIHEYREYAPGFNMPTYAIGTLQVQKTLPRGFQFTAQEVLLRLFTDTRTLNINSPTDENPYGARPLAPDVNILQARNDGTGQGTGQFFGLSNFQTKRVQFFVGGLHLNIRDNNDDNLFFQPQSAYSNAGEEARRDSQGLWELFGNLNVKLPYKVALAMNGFAHGGQPFNLLTGADNNGDGDFNDRPQYAAPGAVANGTTIFQTPDGLLTNAGTYVNGVPQRPIVRDLGALPWTFHLDANVTRTFALNDAKSAHPQTLAVNLRSSNFLNHTNVTAEGNVLGSPQFLVPVSADNGRRIEAGLRYSF